MSTILTPDVLGAVSSLTNYNGNLDKIENAFSDIGPFILSGLVPSAGTGLSVNVTSGVALIGGRVAPSSFTISGLTDATTNHLFLLNTGAGTSNTTGTAPANSCKLGKAVTAGGVVTSVDTTVLTGGRQVKLAITVPQGALTQTYNTADATLSAYTSDPESSAYTGIDNTNGSTVYATVADLNQLRVAYENLRALTEDLAAFTNSLVDKLQAANIVG